MHAKSNFERRKSLRYETGLDGTLSCSRGSRTPVAIVDLSVGGFNIDLGERSVSNGPGFSVKVPGLETLGAELRWADTSNAGFKFERPLHPAVLDHVVRSNPPDAVDE